MSQNASAAEYLSAKEASGPPAVSVLRLLRGFKEDPLTRWQRNQRDHGDVARYRFGLGEYFFIAHPDGAKRVLQDNVANYSKALPSYAMLRRLVGNGLLTSEGSFWLRQRRLAQPAFHRQRLAAMGAQMTAAAVELADSWDERARRGERVLMANEMSRLTLKIVGDALVGAELAAKAAELGASWDLLNHQLVERFNKMRLLPAILPTKYDRDFRHARRTVFRVTDELIAHRRAQGANPGGDLLSMLMAARDEDTGEQMTDGQLRDEVVTMLLAGHETTAVALSWTWALLDLHPAVRAKLANELASVLGGRPPTTEDVPKLPYTRAVIDEAMRLYPPVYLLQRRVVQNDVLCGHRIHRGGVVLLSPLFFHRDARFWPEPEAFRPERWADAEAQERRPRFAYLPFSAGPRQCIGNNFALLEAVLLLATLAQRFEPRLERGDAPAPEYLISLRPAGGLPMRLERASFSSRPAVRTLPA